MRVDDEVSEFLMLLESRYEHDASEMSLYNVEFTNKGNFHSCGEC